MEVNFSRFSQTKCNGDISKVILCKFIQLFNLISVGIKGDQKSLNGQIWNLNWSVALLWLELLKDWDWINWAESVQKALIYALFSFTRIPQNIQAKNKSKKMQSIKILHAIHGEEERN